ncbi:MAG: SDR family NAD(P)-dependent oxidoreductase, partial [Acidobacteriota bacterium]
AVEDDGELMLRSLARLWMHGVSVDWRRLHDGHGRRKVALPSYPFQRRRYWVEPGDGRPAAAAIGRVEEATGGGSKLAAPEDWLHVPVWRPERMTATPIDWEATGPWLALVESVDDPLAGALIEQGATVTLVLRGEAFAWRDPVVTIDPRRSDDYARLVDELAELGRLPRHVLHAWTVTTPGGRVEVGGPDDWETRAFFSLVDLARALGQHADDEVQRSISVVSNELFDVSGAEAIRPEKALIEGPLRVIPAEYPTLQLTAVDIARNGRGSISPAVARRVLSELVAQPVDHAEPVVAYRGSQRWRRGFEPHPLPAAGRWLRDRAVILITGGLGGIGLAIAERLAADVCARLVLVGRSAVPPRDAWSENLANHDDDLASTLRRLVAIEEAGGEVMTLSADVTDGASLRDALAAVHERFGALHGVVHAAGVAGGGLIESRSADDVARVFDAKVRGVPRLWEALGEVGMIDGLDFFALSSSLSAVLGGVGQVDYVAANAFLDAWAREHRRQGGPPIVSIDWDTWSESGMAVAAVAAGGPTLLAARGHDHPLLDRTLVSNDERRVVASDLTADGPWVLAEHQIEGVSLLPGTAYLELAVGALGALPCRVEALSLLNPVFAPDEGTLEIQTFLVHRDDGGWDVSIASPEDAADGRWNEYTRARVRPIDVSPSESVDVDALRASCREAPIEIDPAASRHGAHWAIRGEVYRLGDGELLARLGLPDEYADEVASFVLHPSLMDAATSFFAASGAVRYLPVAYEAVTVSQRLTATVWSHVRRHEDTRDGDETLRFDIDLLDASGGRLARVEGYTLRRIEDTAMRLEEGRAALSARPRSAPARGELDDGLSDVEGAEVLSRVLADGTLAQVLVSTVPLAPRIERYRATTLADLLADTQQLTLPTDRHPRPEISTAYLAPRTEEETVVAEIWAELLGLDAIGVFDDFFELGGHSLLGIQINARLKDRYAVELAPGIIFERPTVALFAEALVDRQGETQLSILEELAVVDAAEAASAGEGQDALSLDVDQLSEGDLDAMLAAMMGEGATS